MARAYAGVSLEAVDSLLAREPYFQWQYTDAITRGAQLRAAREQSEERRYEERMAQDTTTGLEKWREEADLKKRVVTHELLHPRVYSYPTQ